MDSYEFLCEPDQSGIAGLPVSEFPNNLSRTYAGVLFES